MTDVIAECEKTGTKAEKALIAKCRAGEKCILNGGKLPDKDAPDAPTIRADLIRALALQATSQHDKGVWLEGAVITGRLDLSFAKCRGRLVLQTCRFLQKPHMAQSELEQLSLKGSHLPGLFAQGAVVTGDVFLRDLTATGPVDVVGAQIGGQLACDGATLNGGGGDALNAQGAMVAADLFLRGVTATGTVDVAGAQIGGQLDCDRATLNGGDGGLALIGQSLSVEKEFHFRKVTDIAGRVDLTSAHVGDLVDDAASWALCSDLILDGLTYDRIGGTAAPKSFAARKDWLARGSRVSGEFRPQPYTQFAKVMRAAGHLSEARKALAVRDTIQFEVAEAADRKAWHDAYHGGMGTKGNSGVIWLRLHGRRLWAGLSRRVIGHGHHPDYALFWSLALWGAGTIMYFIAYRGGADGAQFRCHHGVCRMACSGEG